MTPKCICGHYGDVHDDQGEHPCNEYRCMCIGFVDPSLAERHEFEWRLVRVPRDWVPTWLWRRFAKQGRGKAVLHDPWRSILTRDAADIDEAIEWWHA